jgi:3-isopropylmalate/(R)-2-methylmalate dehydratase small subunit
MSTIFKGRVTWIFGNHFDVDLIVGVRNIAVTDVGLLLAACMQEYDRGFRDAVRPGDFLVAGSNFGYGHPHPQAMMAMRELGIRVVIAESFAFPFFRSELASGMALVTCAQAARGASRWDELELDLEGGVLKNVSKRQEFRVDPIPPVAVEMIRAGGVVNYLKHTLASSP